MQEAADYDPFLLFGANLKRDLAGEQPYRRALRESGLSCFTVWAPGRREAGDLHLGQVFRISGRPGTDWDLLVVASLRFLPSQSEGTQGQPKLGTPARSTTRAVAGNGVAESGFLRQLGTPGSMLSLRVPGHAEHPRTVHLHR